jgi:hypothetical protein
MLSGLGGWFKRVATNPLTSYVIIIGVLLFLIVHHLGAQPAGMSPAEASARSHSQNLHAIIDNPINMPHNLLAYGLHSASLGWKTAIRLSSAAFAAIFLFCFYLIVRAWFSGPIGLMGTILLLSTPIFLVSARQGSSEIMFFSVIAIMSAYLWAARSEKKDFTVIALAALAGLFLYTPGILWWLAGAVIICRRKLASIVELATPSANVAALFLFAIIITPLGIALAKDWTIIKQLALVPAHFDTVILTLKHIAWMGLSIFVRAPYHNNLILGHLPIMNILQVALLAFGVYALWTAAKPKLAVLLTSIAFAVLAAGFNNNFSILALGVPALAIIVCAGLRYLFIEWRGVFPRNPLAKSLALALMWAVVVIQLLFGIRYAVIAWPNTVDTKTTYVLK